MDTLLLFDVLLKKLFDTDTEFIIECGTNIKYNNQVLDLAQKYANIYAVIGFFPTDVKELENTQNMEIFKTQLKNKNVVGLGEIGLDYHH